MPSPLYPGKGVEIMDSEHYSEQDVLEALRYRSKIIFRPQGYGVNEIRDAIAWYRKDLKGDAPKRARFYANHSNKWVIRKLRILRRQGNAIDRKFRWHLSDAEVVAQKLIGNFK